MADHAHTIDRWDDATGENLIEQIAGVGDYLVALATYRCGGAALAKGQVHVAQPGAGHRAELARTLIPKIKVSHIVLTRKPGRPELLAIDVRQGPAGLLSEPVTLGSLFRGFRPELVLPDLFS
jgi:hypothetical protein